MLFNSVEFFVFFPIVTAAYFAAPHRYRWALLLVASGLFYSAFIPAYLLILCFTILVDYVAGILISRAHGRPRRLFLIASIIANVGVLATFKYFDFFMNALAAPVRLFDDGAIPWHLGLVLPVGLSFHTFQSLSYTIEVYRGRYAAERHLGIFALYVMFYPQLVAGPIERPQHLLPQLRLPHRFDYAAVTSGLQLMMWGLFKKVVIADTLAVAVDRVYARPAAYGSPSLALATLCFSYQIYCDFSGYSDIAIGAARVMGIDLARNFDSPYASVSVAEFWRRWHMSLSTWFRDYVYVPLGGRHASWPRRRWNVLWTFLLSGLWHGANGTFIVWGALHGGYYIAAELFGRTWRRVGFRHTPLLERASGLQRTLRQGATFAAVTYAWIFFRASSMTDALYIAGHIVGGVPSLAMTLLDPLAVRHTLSSVGLTRSEWIIVFGAVAILEAVQWMQRHGGIRARLAQQPPWRRWALYYGVIAYTILGGRFAESRFIYFQF